MRDIKNLETVFKTLIISDKMLFYVKQGISKQV